MIGHNLFALGCVEGNYTIKCGGLLHQTATGCMYGTKASQDCGACIAERW